jgi:hypothetical protein
VPTPEHESEEESHEELSPLIYPHIELALSELDIDVSFF